MTINGAGDVDITSGHSVGGSALVGITASTASMVFGGSVTYSGTLPAATNVSFDTDSDGTAGTATLTGTLSAKTYNLDDDIILQGANGKIDDAAAYTGSGTVKVTDTIANLSDLTSLNNKIAKYCEFWYCWYTYLSISGAALAAGLAPNILDYDQAVTVTGNDYTAAQLKIINDATIWKYYFTDC